MTSEMTWKSEDGDTSSDDEKTYGFLESYHLIIRINVAIAQIH